METKSFVILLLISGATFSLATVRRSYGEECSKTHKCDRKGWLSCHDGICGCAKVDEMYYDEMKGKCITKSGERCKYGVEVEEESGEGNYVEITECVPNARCGVDGLCICDDKYHEIFNGTCSFSNSYGETCAENFECSKAQYLKCLEGICSCPEGSEYSADNEQCVGSLNQTCINVQCLDGAQCSEEGKCLCDEDHYENEGKCWVKKGIRGNCESNIECINKGLLKLQCNNGICNCVQGFRFSKVQGIPLQNEFNGYIQNGVYVDICAPIVGQNCPDGYCIPNAHCETPRYNSGTRNVGTCICSSGFSANDDLEKCGKPYDNRCSKNTDCMNNLVCKEGRCKCSSEYYQMLNGGSTSCISLIGARCTKATWNCIENSSCRLSWNRMTGHCRCNQGFVENSQRKCDGEFGSSCTYGQNSCDNAANLICMDNKCSCSDDMYLYSSEVRKCLGLVGAICKENDDCVQNAYCQSYHPNLLKRCACRSTFVESENSTCRDLFIE